MVWDYLLLKQTSKKLEVLKRQVKPHVQAEAVAGHMRAAWPPGCGCAGAMPTAADRVGRRHPHRAPGPGGWPGIN